MVLKPVKRRRYRCKSNCRQVGYVRKSRGLTLNLTAAMMEEGTTKRTVEELQATLNG
ncbi:hypothetical protein OK016_06050 [Vibrio chagasii]|nr:hypothetical protein [Vibrio chagasii]